MPLGAAEARGEERLNQFLCQCRANDATAQTKQVHIVIFHAPMGRKVVVANSRPRAMHLVGGHAGPDAAPADGDAPLHFSHGDGLGQGRNIIVPAVNIYRLILAVFAGYQLGKLAWMSKIQ